MGAYATPTGEPCPRAMRLDGSVDGNGDCHCCGECLLLAFAPWPSGSDWLADLLSPPDATPR